MTNPIDLAGQTLSAQGVATAEAVAERFAALRAAFDSAAAGIADESAWKVLRDAWVGRKSGVLTRITDNWLKTASPTLRPAVGRFLNELRGHVEQRLEALRAAASSAAETAAVA